MITFEYRCPECSWRYEAKLSPNHEPPKCFNCDTTMVQVLHPPGIHFKGEGWTEGGDRRE